MEIPCSTSIEGFHDGGSQNVLPTSLLLQLGYNEKNLSSSQSGLRELMSLLIVEASEEVLKDLC